MEKIDKVLQEVQERIYDNDQTSNRLIKMAEQMQRDYQNRQFTSSDHVLRPEIMQITDQLVVMQTTLIELKNMLLLLDLRNQMAQDIISLKVSDYARR